MEFAEQVVLITGASRGIGEQVAYRFARAGASLVLTYYQGREDARRVAERCRELGACDALALYVNVMDNDTIRAAVQTVQQRFGTVVVLINNAGVILWKALADHTLEDIETLYRTNAEGMAKIAVAFLPLVRDTLINIGSDIAKPEWFMTGLPLYCVTKSDVRSLSFMLHKACPHLKVYCVNPDRTGTRMNQFEGRAPEQIAEVIFHTALGRYAPGPNRDVDVNTLLG